MTNKEAIKILVGNRNFYERRVWAYDRKIVEALNMAIKALEEIDDLRESAAYYERELEEEWGIIDELDEELGSNEEKEE